MKKISLLVVALLATAALGYAQNDFSFGAEPSSIYPLAALQQTFEEPPQSYLLEKPEFYSPDELLDGPIGRSTKQFPSLALDSAKRKLRIYHSSDFQMDAIYGATMNNQPTLFFFSEHLYKVSFDIAAGEQANLLESLKNRYGKPEKTAEEFNGGQFKSYTWSGYKVAIKLVYHQTGNSTREWLVLEDKLLSKVVEADLEQRKFVQQAMLFSDVVSIYR